MHMSSDAKRELSTRNSPQSPGRDWVHWGWGARRMAEVPRGTGLKAWLREWLAGIGAGFVDSCFPCVCAVCGATTRGGAFLCEGCSGGVARMREGAGGAVGRALCVCCSRAFEGSFESAFEAAFTGARAGGGFCGPCAECARLRPAFECAVAPVKAGGVVREVVHAFKYEGRRHLSGLLADWMQEGLADPRMLDPPVEAWVPVPLHRARLRARGFNQAAVLAAELSRRTGIEVWDVLERVRDTGSQARLGRGARLGNLRAAFRLKREGGGLGAGRDAWLAGRHVVLVDDVLTTGATLDACARALRGSNPGSVRALTVARG